jgi:hypothetical protein
MRTIYCILVFSLLVGQNTSLAQELTGEVLDAIHEKLAREMEDNFFNGESEDSVVIAEEEAWEEFFRTSDLEGEDAVGYSSGLLPPKGIRVGCICMDGTRKDDRGRGACGGFGGVRFWLYQINEDSVAMYPTSRHRIHPEPLTEMETNNLSSRNAFAAEPPAKRRSWYDYRLEDVLIAMMVCITIGYVAKMWFRHD